MVKTRMRYIADVMARSSRYEGPDSRLNMGIVRRCPSLEGWMTLALAGVHVPLKLDKQSIGPPGAMPKGSNYRILERT
jgi:hypothetical protein